MAVVVVIVVVTVKKEDVVVVEVVEEMVSVHSSVHTVCTWELHKIEMQRSRCDVLTQRFRLLGQK